MSGIMDKKYKECYYWAIPANNWTFCSL